MNTACFIDLESFLSISGVSGFSSFAIEHIRKPETTENFHKLIFQGIETIYLIWSFFLSILCDQDLTFKVSKCCLKLPRRAYHLSLKVAFLLLKPKLYLDNKVIAF